MHHLDFSYFFSEKLHLCYWAEGTTINGAVYLDILKDKLLRFLTIHDCDTFQHDGAPCHQAKVTNWDPGGPQHSICLCNFQAIEYFFTVFYEFVTWISLNVCI